MSTNTELVQAALEAFARGDIAGLLSMCSENVTVVFGGDSATIPWAGRWAGKTRVSEYFSRIGETVDVLRWEPQHYVGEGDRVAAFGTTDVRVKSTRQSVIDNQWALDFTVTNGKITGWQVYMDTAAMEKALKGAGKAAV
jgi:ketosteroid isomerase-like protein